MNGGWFVIVSRAAKTLVPACGFDGDVGFSYVGM